MATAYFRHDECSGHVTPDGHPEQVARLAAVERGLAGLPLLRLQAPLGEDADILRCHPAAYLARLRAAVPVDRMVGLDPAPGCRPAACRLPCGPSAGSVPPLIW